MSQKYIHYDLKTKKIVLLDNKMIEKYSNIDNKKIADYYTLNLIEQEYFLFNFPLSKIMKEDKNKFFTTIQDLIVEIKNDQYVEKQIISFKDTENGILNLNYEGICGFANFIIAIFE